MMGLHCWLDGERQMGSESNYDLSNKELLVVKLTLEKINPISSANNGFLGVVRKVLQSSI